MPQHVLTQINYIDNLRKKQIPLTHILIMTEWEQDPLTHFSIRWGVLSLHSNMSQCVRRRIYLLQAFEMIKRNRRSQSNIPTNKLML